LAIREGRVTYANMGKFINYIFASKVSELLPFSRYCHPAHPPYADDRADPRCRPRHGPAAHACAERDAAESDAMRLLDAARLLRSYAFLALAEAALAMLAFGVNYWLAAWRPGLPMVSARNDDDADWHRRADR
jgi:hypothetical protein